MRIPAWMVAMAGSAALAAPALAGDVTKVPAFDQFVVVPLRVHVLTSKDLDLANGRITDAEIAKMASRINAIWSKAGISFGLDSIVREPASQVDRFKALVELENGQLAEIGHVAHLLPTSSRAFDGLHVYIFGELPFNSAYFAGLDAAVVKENPELNPVEGGSKDALSRVAARGLGLAFGLKNRPDDVGLLSNGTNGIGLSEAEVSRARQVARTLPGALDVATATKAAEAASKGGNVALARKLWTWLSEVPGAGPGATQAKKRLQALPSGKP